jgi:homogentisate 1,2-dioxygenase
MDNVASKLGEPSKVRDHDREAPISSGELSYQAGFGNDFSSEAIPGTLPIGQNCVKIPAHGLVHEVINATAFTAPRAHNQRAHFYRIRPSVSLSELEPRDSGLFVSAPLEGPVEANAIRWSPFEIPAQAQDFFEGIVTLCANGSAEANNGMAMHVYLANRSMGDRVFSNGDGEMMIIPHEGRIRIVTELGMLDVEPGELALIPRGCKMKVELHEPSARGWVCENYGVPFQLPELGLIGSQGQANAWDFQVPVAAFEDSDVRTQVIHKLGGAFWEGTLEHSPFDVVAWRGNWMPCKFDMSRFMVVGAVAFDHSDPSIYCALTSPGDAVGGANIDFMIMPPRWLVAERTFRPAAFHRNAVSEFLGVVYDKAGDGATKVGGGAATLHNNWAPHGPDSEMIPIGRAAAETPIKFERLFFMLESRAAFKLTDAARNGPERSRDYYKGWSNFPNDFRANRMTNNGG